MRSFRKFGGADNGDVILGLPSEQHFLFQNLFQSIGLEVTSDKLLRTLESHNDVGVFAAIYVILAQSFGRVKPESATGLPYVSYEGFNKLGDLLLQKIEVEVGEGTLSELPYYNDVVWAWNKLAGPDPVRVWLADEAKRNGHSLAKISRCLLGQFAGKSEKLSAFIQNEIVPLCDFEAIEMGCSIFSNADGLTANERNSIQALKGALDGLRKFNDRHN